MKSLLVHNIWMDCRVYDKSIDEKQFVLLVVFSGIFLKYSYRNIEEISKNQPAKKNSDSSSDTKTKAFNIIIIIVSISK